LYLNITATAKMVQIFTHSQHSSDLWNALSRCTVTFCGPRTDFVEI